VTLKPGVTGVTWRTGVRAQVVEHLPGKREVLSSNTDTTKNRKQKKIQHTVTLVYIPGRIYLDITKDTKGNSYKQLLFNNHTAILGLLFVFYGINQMGNIFYLVLYRDYIGPQSN
jgi:hypothetical protein